MSADLDVTFTITREELELPALNTHDPDAGYTLVRGGLGLGSRTWRRQTVESPFTHTRTMVSRRIDVDVRDFHYRVKKVGTVTAHDHLEALVEAFSQFSYTLTLDLGGRIFAWFCETADWTIGDAGAVDDLMAISHMYEITFHVPIIRVVQGYM